MAGIIKFEHNYYNTDYVEAVMESLKTKMVLKLNKIEKFLKMSRYEKRISICRNTYRFFYRRIFGSIGKRSYIYKPYYVSGHKHMFLGNDVAIWHNARIEAIDEWNGVKYSPKLKIGNNVIIGQNLHMTLAENIEIDDNVICTGRVTITDINHLTDDISKPVIDQGIMTKPVHICEGAFIGINAVILPGVTVGKHAVIGAGAVVTKDVPDYATAAGCPARILKIDRKS